MQRYNTIYYLLFFLLVMGAFASMAQNSYGLTLLGWVAAAFGLLFLYQCVRTVIKKEKGDVSRLAEPACMSVMSFIFALRVFHVRFPFVEYLFAAACIILVVFYGKKLLLHYNGLKKENNRLAITVALFYACIIAFIISLLAVTLLPRIAENAGRLAFVLLLAFVVLALLGREYLVGGEKKSVTGIIYGFRDRSILLFTLFLIISLYTVFTRTGIIPKLYSDDFPQAYYELVDDAETRKELPVNGEYRHEEFKKQYDQFISSNIRKEP